MTICRFSAQQIDQRLPPRISVDIEIGIDADDAVNAEPCGGFGDGGVGQVQGQAGETLGDAVDGWQAGVGGDVHLDRAAFDPGRPGYGCDGPAGRRLRSVRARW